MKEPGNTISRRALLKAAALTLLAPSSFIGSAAAAEEGEQLFGSAGTFSSSSGKDYPCFTKWTGVLKRYAQEEGHEPAVWQELIQSLKGLDLRAKLEAVNTAINNHPYVSSYVNWHESNHWETPSEFLAKGGQCQDFVVTKYFLLRAAGVPDAKLQVVVVRDKIWGDHAVLVADDNGQKLVLDNINKNVLPATERKDLSPYYAINQQGVWMFKSALSQFSDNSPARQDLDYASRSLATLHF